MNSVCIVIAASPGVGGIENAERVYDQGKVLAAVFAGKGENSFFKIKFHLHREFFTGLYLIGMGKVQDKF